MSSTTPTSNPVMKRRILVWGGLLALVIMPSWEPIDRRPRRRLARRG